MLGWLHRSVIDNGVSMARDEIARAVRAVRAACWGRKCLAKCARRMTAAAPLRRPRCGGAAAVAAVLLLAMSARAVVFCRWTGSEYVCSGGGDTVTVIGGGDGWQGDIIVTNIVGVCTNCVAMSPEYVREWKEGMNQRLRDESMALDYLIESCQLTTALLSPYTNSYPVSGLKTSSANRTAVTNFVQSTPGVLGSKPYHAAESAYSSYPPSGSDTNARRWISAYDGAAIAYNDVADEAVAALDSVKTAERQTRDVQNRLQSLGGMFDLLSEEECTAQWEPGDSGGDSGGGESGGGSTIVTNQISGNWCTYDQGEAIKDLLDEIKEWERKQANYLNAISNRVASIDETIKSALFTSYTHIPTEDELQTSWQDLYLSGGNDNFPDYPATNIVARIELLLAGISGVLTNVNDYASQDEFADGSLDSTNLVEIAIGDMTNEFVNVMQGRASSARSVGDALIGLYQKFRTWSGTPFSTENLINSYSVEVEDGKSLDIPGFAAPAKTLPWANLIRVVCRSAMSVIWILMTVAVFVRFQIAFFQWCFKYVKWAVEVLQGLFV